MNENNFPWIDEFSRVNFPDPETCDPDGPAAQGGNLSPGMLLSAYEKGFFPWFNEDDPVFWWCPDPRMVLKPRDCHVSRSMKKFLAQGSYQVSVDRSFETIIRLCGEERAAAGTWITEDIMEAYTLLHQMGKAHSVEVWEEGELVGGLYGLALGRMFFGESMVSLRPNASKTAFITLCRALENAGYELVDCQLPTEHLYSLGAFPIPRSDFLQQLSATLKKPDGWPAVAQWIQSLNT